MSGSKVHEILSAWLLNTGQAYIQHTDLGITIILLPKYRKRVIKGKIAIRIKQLFFQACQINKWWIDELNVQPDHVHLLIQTKPRESVSQVVQLLKSGSSKVIRIEYPELEEYRWGDSFWSDGYFGESVGVVNESVIKN